MTKRKIPKSSPSPLSDDQSEHLQTVSVEVVELEELSEEEVRDRITKLRNRGNLEAAASTNLKHLGEVRRPYLKVFKKLKLTVD